MKPELGYEQNPGWELLCPCCGSKYLYHHKVEVFERREDAESGLHVTTGYANIEINNDITGNPSCRRNGLKIFFDCEDCNAELVLSLSQHKGHTYVNFDYAEPEGGSNHER